jgi:hypothetical protein
MHFGQQQIPKGAWKTAISVAADIFNNLSESVSNKSSA